MRIFSLLLCSFTFLSCAPSLPRSIIENHPTIKITVLEPQVVESSSAIPPAWTRRLKRGAVAYVPFAGQSFAPTQDGAKAQAMRDLLAAVSNFIAVEVESEVTDVETMKQKDGKTESSLDARSMTRSRTVSALEGIQPDEIYWEKVVASPLTPQNVSYRFFVHARVPKAEITRARLKKQLERQQKSGRKMVVVLPFHPPEQNAETMTLANAFAEDLSRRLGEAEGLHVADPGMVRAMLAGRTQTEAEALETIRNTFLPDFIVGGSYQIHRDRLRVTFSLYGGEDRGVLRSRSVERRYRELFDLQEDLLEAIRGVLGVAAKKSKTEMKTGIETAAVESKPPDLAAYEAYHEAFALYRAGKNTEALAALAKSLELSPDFGYAQLRMGRVLERMGKYGRIPPHHRDSKATNWFPDLCTTWSEISKQSQQAFLTASEGLQGAYQVDISVKKKGANVDHVLSAADYVVKGGRPMPDPGVPRLPESAVGAYYNALRQAVESGDEALWIESLFALADLGVRVDRLDLAYALYQTAHEFGVERDNDHHILSLAHYGFGKIERMRGNYDVAIKQFSSSLDFRVVLGEKPYLLEIFNELGGVHVEVSRYQAAYGFYRKAQRIAEDLGNDYFSAVLANNLGVLEYLSGRIAEAEVHFNQAWEYLNNIRETEGQIAAGLNVSLTGFTRGDLERARAYLREARRIVFSTSQEGRLALVYNHAGMQQLAEGDRLTAMRSLLRGWALFNRLGQSAQNMRLRNNIAVAEYQAFVTDTSTGEARKKFLKCVRESFRNVLRRGYGWYLHEWARDYPQLRSRGRRYRAPPRAPPPPAGQTAAAEGVTFAFTRLNAELVGRLMRGAEE